MQFVFNKDMAAFSFLFISLLEFLIFILGTFGNFITCSIVFKNKQLQNSAYFYVVSLAAADFMTCAVLVPTRSLQHLGIFIENTSLTQFGLVYVPAIGRVTLLASFINLAALSIDRFIAVSFPFYYRFSFRNSKKVAFAVIFGIWVLAIFFTSLPEFQVVGQQAGLLLFVTCIITMTFIILALNARVLFLVRRQSRFRRQLMPSPQAENIRKVFKHSNLKVIPVNEDESATKKRKENKATSSLKMANSNPSARDVEDLNMAVQYNCHRSASVVFARQDCSTNLHETRVYGTSVGVPVYKNNESVWNKDKREGGRVIRRHSWPKRFYRNRRNHYETQEDSKTDLEMSEIVQELPNQCPNANQNSHNDEPTNISANIRQTGNKEEKKTAVSVAIVILVFIILVYPRVSLIFYHFFNPETSSSSVVRLWLRVFMYTNSAVNPLLYAWRMARFRKEFKSMISCKN